MWLKDLFEAAIFVSCLLTVRTSTPLEVAPGVTYAEYTLPGPNRVFVVACERSRREYGLAVGWPKRTRNFTKRATTSAIAAAYDQPPLHDVVAAVNASFFGLPPIVIGATASYGELEEMPDGSHDTLVLTADRQPRIVEDLSPTPGLLTLADGRSLPIDEFNRRFTTGRVVAYLSGWGLVSSAQDDLVAVVMRDVAPPVTTRRPVIGIVQEVLTGAAAERIATQPGQLVIVADCERGDWLRTHLAPGAMVTFSLGMEFGEAPLEMAITGIGYLVRCGEPHRTNWRQYQFSTVRHPRTVLAWNASKFFLIVIDGRSLESVGMTFAEMSDFLITVLQADEALNLDGGGSSAIVVDGIVRNVPSDGGERAVNNAVLLVSHPPDAPAP